MATFLTFLGVLGGTGGIWVLAARRRVHAYHDGRRDYLAGRVDRSRTDAYRDGVIDQMYDTLDPRGGGR